jgi:hypothetical protein
MPDPGGAVPLGSGISHFWGEKHKHALSWCVLMVHVKDLWRILNGMKKLAQKVLKGM